MSNMPNKLYITEAGNISFGKYPNSVEYVRKEKPVKNCVSCGKPIINPKSYRADIHTSDIKGVRSKCAKKRDRETKKLYAKTVLRPSKPTAKPVGIQEHLNKKSKRICLKCDKIFTSESLHNRICKKCANLQPDIMNFHNATLETASLSEFLELGYD